ncbi:hypothetical protein [Gordonia sp. CPCC 205333]|uniref:hypothetical protein n=1 Tax=Gordonia sp. CPCC 205333 TaxID=3140790 RepID=UPI003AF3E171
MNLRSIKTLVVGGALIFGATLSSVLAAPAANADIRHEASVLCAAGTCKNNGPNWDVGFGNVVCGNGVTAPGIALVPPHGIAPLASAACQQPRLYG